MSLPALVIIPARLQSTRLPGKLLQRIGPRSVLEWTWLAANESDLQVVIATDADEIEREARHFGATVIRTGECRNGTERCAAVMKELGSYPRFVINWQGDSPCAPGSLPRLLVSQIGSADVATPVRRIVAHEPGQAVALCRDEDMRALMFTRQPAPTGGPYWAHIGMYCYRLASLGSYGQRPSGLEEAESLEQLRWLELRMVVKCVPVVDVGPCREVNEPRDLALVARDLGVHG